MSTRLSSRRILPGFQPGPLMLSSECRVSGVPDWGLCRPEVCVPRETMTRWVQPRPRPFVSGILASCRQAHWVSWICSVCGGLSPCQMLAELLAVLEHIDGKHWQPKEGSHISRHSQMCCFWVGVSCASQGPQIESNFSSCWAPMPGNQGWARLPRWEWELDVTFREVEVRDFACQNLKTLNWHLSRFVKLGTGRPCSLSPIGGKCPEVHDVQT